LGRKLEEARIATMGCDGGNLLAQGCPDLRDGKHGIHHGLDLHAMTAGFTGKTQ
jgi:hypothetical protein